MLRSLGSFLDRDPGAIQGDPGNLQFTTLRCKMQIQERSRAIQGDPGRSRAISPGSPWIVQDCLGSSGLVWARSGLVWARSGLVWDWIFTSQSCKLTKSGLDLGSPGFDLGSPGLTWAHLGSPGLDLGSPGIALLPRKVTH